MRVGRFTEELFLIGDMESLTSAYEEISVMKMQQIRAGVLSTRDFMSQVTDVFRKVRVSYRQQVERLMKGKKNQQVAMATFSTVPNNGKDITVLLSANAKLYGDIIPRTFEAFQKDIESSNADIAIVGLIGKETYEDKGITKPYTYFQIKDIATTMEDLKPLLQHISQYRNVKVYYGKFENVITQHPDVSLVSGQQALEQQENQAEQNAPQNEEEFKFFFEPSLDTILHFFETQLFSSLFKQTLSEHELARYASRITAMEEATTNIHNRKRNLLHLQKREQNTVDNAKQLSALSGMALWQRKNI